MLSEKTVLSILAYQDNAITKDSTKGHITKDSTKGHTSIKDLLFEEIKEIPKWNTDKYPGKTLKKNAKKTIREYLYQYLEISDLDFKATTETDKAEMTDNELYEELGALIALYENEVDDSVLFNLTKAKVNNPSLINSTSTNIDEIVEKLKKVEQELSIESYMQLYIKSLQQLNFILTAPIVGDRKVSHIHDEDIYKKMVKVSLDLWKEFGEKIPFSLIYPGMVDEKAYIIAAVKGIPVYNIPAEYKDFPLLIDYGTIKSSFYDAYQNLESEISISSAEIGDACTLRALFKAPITVVGDVDSSVIQPGKVDNVLGNSEMQCTSGPSIDNSSIFNNFYEAETIISDIQSILRIQYKR